MASAALPGPPNALLPQPPGGNGPGLLLALAAHGLLLLALTTAVDWRTQPPDTVSAELWAAVPQSAAPLPPAAAPAPLPTPAPTPAPAPAPPPPAPAPPPPQAAPVPAEPDITTERRKAEAARKKAEDATERQRLADDKKRADDKRRAEDNKKKADDERKQREQAEKEARAQDERLARQREENLRRMMGQAGTAAPGAAAAGTGTAAQTAAPSSAYIGRLVALVRGNLIYTGTMSDNKAAEVEVRATPSGTILSRRLVKSSGQQDWDEAVLRAIDRTGTLPRDSDGRVPSPLLFAVRPRE